MSGPPTRSTSGPPADAADQVGRTESYRSVAEAPTRVESFANAGRTRSESPELAELAELADVAMQAAEIGTPASAANRPTRIDRLRRVPADARRWVETVRVRARRRWTERVVDRIALSVIVALIGGVIGRAALIDCPVRDHSGEIARLEQQLIEEQARGERLSRHLRSLDARPEVREHAIRSELGMLRKGERFVVFE